MKLDVSDTEHNAWLVTFGSNYQMSFNQTPTSYLHMPGSRYDSRCIQPWQSILQCQTIPKCLYQTASPPWTLPRRRYLFSMGSFPLHHQDWACPNRKGLLEVIVGRLEFSMGEIDAGMKTLQQSIQSSKESLDKVDQAQQGLITTPKPPMMGGPPNKQQNLGNTPNQQMIGHPQKWTPSVKRTPKWSPAA